MAARRQWTGNEALRRTLRPVKALTPHPRNPRRGDVEEISASLQRFGQQRPIVVDGEGRILAGNHTYRAALAIGWTHIAAIESDLPDDEAERYLVADNRTSDLGTYDNPALAAALAATPDLEGTGYSDDDRAVAAALAAPARTQPPDTHHELALRIIFRYDRETYKRIVERMDALMVEFGVETYSDVVERVATQA